MSPHRNGHAGQFQDAGAPHCAKRVWRLCSSCLAPKLQCEQGTAKEVPRADLPEFRDVSRAMHVRPQVTLNAREVDVVLGLLTRNAHAHLSRCSSISGTEFIGLLDDAIESILEPTETVTVRNTGTTTMTNDTSFVSVTGATSPLSASQSGAASQSKAFVAYCSSNAELQNAFVSQPPPLFVQPLATAVDADGNEIGQQRGQSMDPPLDPCQGRSERPPVSLQEQQVTSSDPLQGRSAGSRQTATARQWRSLLQALLSSTRSTMSGSGPRWTKVATPPVTARVGQLAQSGVSTCLASSQSIARTPGPRFSQDLAAMRLPQLDVASSRLHLPSRRKLPGDGPFLFPIDAQARLGLIKDMTKNRFFIKNKPGFYLWRYKDAKTGLMLVNMADSDLLNDQALTPQLLRASKPMYSLPATIPPPTSITGGGTASGEPVNILRSLAPMLGNETLRFTHVAIGLDTDGGHDNENTKTSLLLHLQPSFGVLDSIREQQIGKKRCVC